MRYLILFLLPLAVFFSSCKKDSLQGPLMVRFSNSLPEEITDAYIVSNNAQLGTIPVGGVTDYFVFDSIRVLEKIVPLETLQGKINGSDIRVFELVDCAMGLHFSTLKSGTHTVEIVTAWYDDGIPPSEYTLRFQD